MFNTSTRTLRLVLLSLVIILTVSCFGWALQRGPKLTKAAPVFNIITVNTTADDNTVNSNCTLREAILAANTNAAVDACGAGAAGTDTIQFSIGTGTPTINVTGALPNLTEPVVIDGATGGATRVELNGLGAGAGVDGLTLQAGNSTIKSLVINRFSQNGIVTKPTGGNTIQNCFIGTDAMGQTDLGNGLNGISNDGGVNNLIGGTTPGTGNLISGNNQDGILFFGGGNGNQVQGNFIGTDVNGTAALGNNGQGVNIPFAEVAIGGTAAGARNVISGNGQNGVKISIGSSNVVLGNYIGTNAAGNAALGNTANGVEISGGNITIGGATVSARNVISGNLGSGVLITGVSATNATVRRNYIGTDVTGNTALGNSARGISVFNSANDAHIFDNLISGNTAHGVEIDLNADDSDIHNNLIGTNAAGTGALGNGGSGVLISNNSNDNTIGGFSVSLANTIAFNGADGVRISPSGTGNRVLGNSIFSNTNLGIDLSGNGITANDAGDGDTGPNNLQNFPVLTAVTSTGFVSGSLNSTIVNSAYPVRIEFFANASCDASGNGEGEVYLGTEDLSAPGNFPFQFSFTPIVGKPFITATGTDQNGNTSEFSACRAMNIAPTISAVTNTRTAGSSATNSQIATVADPDQVLNTLTVQVNSGASATVNGVTVSNLSVTAGGMVNADVVASCAATNATFTLKVIDNANEMNTATLTVNVTANAAPTLTYGNVSVSAGGSTTNNPTTATDNGSITGYVVQSVGTYTGTISVNASGLVSISNAAPVGAHTITIRATDNCGATTDATFTLTVDNNLPMITAGAALTRQRGTAGSVATIATVSDSETAVGSLVVTATTVPAGITVTSITNTAGTITATVAADCTAALGNNTVVLTVTDGNSGTNTANLTVNVTANAAPTLTYGNVSVSAGGSTTNNPTTATDNGSITGYVVQSVGTYTGTISVNASGLVSISNAAPVGAHTITIRATDNCGATTDATFTLTVDNNPPMITAGAALTRQRGTAGSVATIATVSDSETAVGSLVVTATTVPAGITVTSITNTAGTITATVAADCTATLGNNTVVLTVTDGNSGTATANLTVNVTANAAPTLTYGAASVSAGGSITNSPTTATDNGSITGYAVQSQGTYTGTISVNASGLVSISNAAPVGAHTITIRATDNCGATTDVTFTLTVDNNPPMITAGATLTRQRGTAGSISTIATVSDGETAVGSLVVTATTVPAGITVTGITNTAGAITATVAADCTAALGNNTVVLTVTDGNSGTATANLTINVAANTAPTLAYGNVSVSAGASTTNNPTTATDNGSITGYVVQSVGTYTGTISVNASGLVSISNATPVGVHTITIRATDNCGATTDATFTLTVDNNPPMITAGAALTRQRGTAGGVSTIATVSDGETAVGSLVVTATTVPAGITVTGITNTAGAITATFAADCTATLGNNTVVLTVTDGNSGMATANLTVNVTANTAPTLSYGAASVSAGGSTTNSPTTATDNGSITGYVVQSVGTYTGTISVNASGLVSISNATPIGAHIITIRATDNCGATTDATFTLTVGNNLPMITAGAALTRQRGTVGSVSPIATVSDLETAAGSLTVTATTVPAGLTVTGITNTAGAITATVVADCTATLGNNTVVLTVTDGNSGTATANLTISVTANTAPTLTYAATSVSAGGATSNSPTTATDNGSITGYAVQSAGTYTGTISVNASGVVSFSNAAPVGSHMITIQATDNCGTSTTAQFELTVVTCPQITITPASLLNGVPGTAYNQALTQMGGALPVTWSLSAGALPPGLTLSGSGVLAGTPSTIGTSDFTVQVSDSNGCIGTRAYKLTISCAVITPSAEFSLVEGSTNSVTVNSPDSCNWMAESNTPWITIGGNRARSGSGTVNYTVTPNPDATPRTGMLTVAGYRFFVQQGASGLLVSEDFENGIPANWAVLDGGSGGGTASTWTTANPCGRVILPPFNGRVALADAACAGSGTVQDEQLILPVFNATGLGRVVLQFFNRFKLDFGPTHTGDVDVSLDGGAIWTNAFRQVTVDGDQTPTLKTIDITSLVAPNPAKVLVRFHYYGQVPEGNRPTGGALIEWPIDACRISYFALSATSQSFAVNGGPGSVNVTAAAGAAWTVQSNDAWITALTTAGTGNGTANFTVAPNQTATPRTGTLTIAGNTLTVSQAGTCNPITVNPATLTNGRAGMVYSQTLSQTGGTGAITWTVSTGSLPAGLTLSSGGLMTGTPTVFGAFNFTARATDPNLCTGERAYTLTIDPPCVPGDITVNPATLLNGFAGAAYTQTLTATGGTAPYSFGLPTGSLPNGLTLASGGALTGTPTAAGTFNFTVTATDANGCTGTRVYTVIVSGNGLQFYPLISPVRALETRGKFMGCVNPGAPINAGASFTLAVRTGCTGIPANALAVTGNVTVVPGAAGGYLTLFPSSATQPIIANSNFKPFEVTNNVFTTGLGAGDGAFRIFASAATEVIVDITGYYAPPAANGLYFHALPEPVRLVETRTLPGLTGCIKPGTPLTGGQDFAVQGRSPVAAPCNVIPTAAQVLVGNATSVIPAGAGFLTIFPSDAARPLIASSNYVGADIINGPFAVKLGADGQFKVYTQATTELVIDILGYYSTEATDANGAGLLFNPLDKPVRLLETRADFPGFPPLTGCYRPNAKIPGGTGGIRTQPSWGICEGLTIPTTARALIGNATVVNVDGAGFMTFYPGNVASTPTVATSNYPVPVIFGYNRHFIVGVGPSDGTFKILTQWTTDLIVDVAGYFAP